MNRWHYHPWLIFAWLVAFLGALINFGIGSWLLVGIAWAISEEPLLIWKGADRVPADDRL